MNTFVVTVERVASFKEKKYTVRAEDDEDAMSQARELAADDGDWTNTHNEYEPESYKQIGEDKKKARILMPDT